MFYHLTNLISKAKACDKKLLKDIILLIKLCNHKRDILTSPLSCMRKRFYFGPKSRLRTRGCESTRLFPIAFLSFFLLVPDFFGSDVGIYQALEDFSGEESDEVSYKKGEELQVIESNLDGWWKVRTYVLTPRQWMLFNFLCFAESWKYEILHDVDIILSSMMYVFFLTYIIQC